MNKKSIFRIGITALGVLLFAFCTNASSQTPSGERDQMGGEGRGGPPQEAIDACSKKSESAPCTFEAPRGSLTGECRTMRGQKVCVPEGAPQRQPEGKEGQSKDARLSGRGAPPQEAIDACSSKKEEDSCNVETPHGSLSGSCRSIESQLACVPEKGKRGDRKEGGQNKKGMKSERRR